MPAVVAVGGDVAWAAMVMIGDGVLAVVMGDGITRAAETSRWAAVAARGGTTAAAGDMGSVGREAVSLRRGLRQTGAPTSHKQWHSHATSECSEDGTSRALLVAGGELNNASSRRVKVPRVLVQARAVDGAGACPPMTCRRC